MPPAYDIHPEFGYFCPAPRARRELRVAVVSILAGMAIGAAIMAIHAGQAAETDGCFGQCAAEIVGSRPVGGRASSEPPHQGRRQRQGGSCGNDQAVSDADGASAFEQGSVTPCRDSARPYRAAGATSLRRSGLARERRGSGLARGFTAGAISRGLPSPPFPGPRSGQALCMPDAIGTTRMRTRAGRTGVGPTGASAPMPKIDIGAAHIATGCTDDNRCRGCRGDWLLKKPGWFDHQTAIVLTFAVKTSASSDDPEQGWMHTSAASPRFGRNLTDALTAAGPPLLFGVAAVGLGLSRALRRVLARARQSVLGRHLRGDRVPAAARGFAAQGLVPDDRHRGRRHNDRGADRVLSAGSHRLSRCCSRCGAVSALSSPRCSATSRPTRRRSPAIPRRSSPPTRSARPEARVRRSSCWRSRAPARSASGSCAPASFSPGPISAAPSAGSRRHSPIWRPRSRADLPACWHWRGRNCRTRKPSGASSSGASSRSTR